MPPQHKDEAQFQEWYRGIVERRRQMGMPLGADPYDPRQNYDFYGLYKAIQRGDIKFPPDNWANLPEGQAGHFPSTFKSADHPNRVINGVDTTTGKRVAPSWYHGSLTDVRNITPSMVPGPARTQQPSPWSPTLSMLDPRNMIQNVAGEIGLAGGLGGVSNLIQQLPSLFGLTAPQNPDLGQLGRGIQTMGMPRYKFEKRPPRPPQPDPWWYGKSPRPAVPPPPPPPGWPWRPPPWMPENAPNIPLPGQPGPEASPWFPSRPPSGYPRGAPMPQYPQYPPPPWTEVPPPEP